MNKGQIRGMLAISLGFIIVTLAGIALSFLADSVFTTVQTIITAFIIFLTLSPLFGYGILTYARSTENEVYTTNDDMEKPRLLLDYLRSHGNADVTQLAQELDTIPSQIRLYIDDLSQLSLFSGIADWDNGIIAMVEPSVMNTLDTCKNCKKPIKILDNKTICQHCATEYYKLTN